MTAGCGNQLPHGDETSVWADKGYVSAEREAAFAGPDRFWGVMRTAPRGGKLDPIDEDINRIIAMVRAKVEHPFRVIKRQLGYVKTRYRGVAKNRTQLFTLSSSRACLPSSRHITVLDHRYRVPKTQDGSRETIRMAPRHWQDR